MLVKIYYIAIPIAKGDQFARSIILCTMKPDFIIDNTLYDFTLCSGCVVLEWTFEDSAQ